MHYPCAMDPDVEGIKVEDVKYTDTWRAMEACVDAGLVRNIGVSSELGPGIVLQPCGGKGLAGGILGLLSGHMNYPSPRVCFPLRYTAVGRKHRKLTPHQTFQSPSSRRSSPRRASSPPCTSSSATRTCPRTHLWRGTVRLVYACVCVVCVWRVAVRCMAVWCVTVSRVCWDVPSRKRAKGGGNTSNLSTAPLPSWPDSAPQ